MNKKILKNVKSARQDLALIVNLKWGKDLLTDLFQCLFCTISKD